MSDPTIPRQQAHPTTKVGGWRAVPTVGRIVDQGENGTWLVTDRGDRTPVSPQIMQGTGGDAYEGTDAPPRMWRYNASGQPTQIGDLFLVLFIENDPNRPVLLGGWRPLSVTDPSFLPVDPVGQDADRWRWRKVGLGGSGVDRHVDVRVLEAGKVVEVEVGGALGSGLTVTIDADRGRVKVSNGGSTDPVGNGLGILRVLSELLTASAGIVPTPPNAPILAQLITSVEAELAAGTGPRLCSTLHAE